MWTVNEIINATGSSSPNNAGEVASVTIDSRKLTAGCLFVALNGERVDGHGFVKNALSQGASAALVERVPEGVTDTSRLIIVKDTYKALVDLARASRKRAKGKIIAVTGSVGKTGTKDAIRTSLTSSGSTYATQGNLNNHIGLPLSLANLSEKTNFGIFELGMNHSGEISYLTEILRPDIAVITNIEAVHLEFFPDIAAIADAKAEIMEGIDRNGTIILNRDNNFYEHLLHKAHEHGISNILTFGEHKEANCRLISYELQDFGSQIEAIINGVAITYHIGTTGRHWAITSLAALAASTSAGADLANSAATLANFHEPEGRGKIHLVNSPHGNITIIDDCYNASPVSMNAAIAKLAELQSHKASNSRKIAVLGDMLELGSASEELHISLLAALKQHNIDKVYASGRMMKHLYEALPEKMRGAHAENAAALSSILIDELKENDIILIKGSRGSRMDIVRDSITNKPREPVNAV